MSDENEYNTVESDTGDKGRLEWTLDDLDLTDNADLRALVDKWRDYHHQIERNCGTRPYTESEERSLRVAHSIKECADELEAVFDDE